MTRKTKFRLTTTLNLLRENGACEDGYRKLRKALGAKWPKDKPINLLRQVLKSNGVQDMAWCFRATREDSRIPRTLIAADFAESVLHIFTAQFPNDNRPALAIKVARDAAGDAALAAGAAAGAAGDAALAAGDAALAAGAAAGAAWAAGDAAWAAGAVWAAGNAARAAGNAARAAGNAAEETKQIAIIKKWLR
jgi:hypothetical protein